MTTTICANGFSYVNTHFTVDSEKFYRHDADMKFAKLHKRTGAAIPVMDNPHLYVRLHHESGALMGMRVEISPGFDDRGAGTQEHVLYLSIEDAWELSAKLHEKMRIVTKSMAERP